MCRDFSQVIRPKWGTFSMEFCRGWLFYFFLPKTPSICIFLSSFLAYFLLLFLFCGIANEETDLHVAYYDSSLYSLNFIFHSPPFSVRVPGQHRLSLVSLLAHFDTKPCWSFPDVGLNVNLRSQEWSCLHSGTKSISLPFGPCTFFLQRGQTLALGPERTEGQRRLLHCVLWGRFLLTLLG